MKNAKRIGGMMKLKEYLRLCIIGILDLSLCLVLIVLEGVITLKGELESGIESEEA